MMSDSPDTHLFSVCIEASFEQVWDQITDPMNFPELYPAWTVEVEQVDDETFEGAGPNGDNFLIRPILDHTFGVIDFEVKTSGSVEYSRSRLFRVDEHTCQLVHLAVRWENIDDTSWETHTRGTENDLKRMKQLIEDQ
jgi:hypothetical protein